MKKYLPFLFLFPGVILPAQITLRTAQLQLSLNPVGQIIRITDNGSGTNYAPSELPGYLIRVRTTEQKELVPLSMRVEGQHLQFRFEQGITLQVNYEQNKDFLRFGLANAKPAAKIDAILWGPVRSTICDTVGEVVGVVRNATFALGIQSLNAKTIGGKMDRADGATAGYAGITGSTATCDSSISSLQAFCINAALERRVDVVHYPQVTVKPIPGYTLEGSAIALFGVPSSEALPTIGKISKGEHLPWQEINGEWIRTSPERNRPYLITNFNEDNFDEMLELTKRLGFHCIYHEHPFENWGHFKLLESVFPHGRAGLKACVEKAKAANIIVGVHTLTNFITTNDPFVGAGANAGLMAIGQSTLSGSISAEATEIPIDRPDKFDLETTLNCVRIGDELIRYRALSKDQPWRLLDCVRGAYDTPAQAHAQGAIASRLADHGYKTLFPDWQMQEEMIRNIADFFNETGVAQLDFDGHEGALYTGHGDYGTNYYVERFLQQVGHTVYNGSSIMNHYYWHLNSYINWGEPWYAGFRESQADHRFRLQPFFERNYMPHMLGWFLVNTYTAAEDVEWMMAVSAGYDAGFALVMGYDAYKKNPESDKIISIIANWQEAKKRRVFSAAQLERLRDTRSDFQLERSGDQSWHLQYFDKYRFEHARRTMQPGEPNTTIMTFEQTNTDAAFQLRLAVSGEGARVSGISVELDGFQRVVFPTTLQMGESLVWSGGAMAVKYDDKGKPLENINTKGRFPVITKGDHSLSISATQMEGEAPVIKGVLRLKGQTEHLGKQ